MYGGQIIEQAPLQVYYSTLMFAPRSSVVKKQFLTMLPMRIKKLPNVEYEWNALYHTLAGHSDYVSAVVFSPDGQLLASASHNRTVKLWDAGTGAERQTLVGHSL
jgi:WD40 repeat protein